MRAPPSLDLFPPQGPPAQTFRGDVEQRNDEDTEQRSGEHPAEHRRAHRLAGDGAGAFGDDQREETKDEREARHHHRAKPQARGFDGRAANVLARGAAATIKMPFWAASAISTTSPIWA